MQKFSASLAWLLLLLFILHLLTGSVTLFTSVFLKQSVLSCTFLAVACLHAILSLYKALGQGRLHRLGAYGRENRAYLLRLLSGGAILLLVFVHRTLWVVETPFGLLPKYFGWPSLLAQLLLTAAVAVHVLLNLRPLLIDTGLDAGGRTKKAMAALLALLLIVSVCGAAAYFAEAAL